ncbi:hypothetical protein BGP_4147 [Beggiatoa sp. PS]|nr:hypothetical protein BGP_4147 [Beggiatoa sp. PS]
MKSRITITLLTLVEECVDTIPKWYGAKQPNSDVAWSVLVMKKFGFATTIRLETTLGKSLIDPKAKALDSSDALESKALALEIN